MSLTVPEQPWDEASTRFAYSLKSKNELIDECIRLIKALDYERVMVRNLEKAFSKKKRP